jgi:hypothetical protein
MLQPHMDPDVKPMTTLNRYHKSHSEREIDRHTERKLPLDTDPESDLKHRPHNRV